MPNGRPGDHPITDVLIHKSEEFSPRVNALIRDVYKLGGMAGLDPLMDDLLDVHRSLARLDFRLVEVREELKQRRHDAR